MSHAPSDALRKRHEVVRRAFDEQSLDALVVTALPNILYLTNFGGSAAIVVLTRARLIFITDFRYVTAVNDTRGTPSECPDLDLVVVDGSYDATLGRVLAAMSGARIGFEAASLTVSRHTWLKNTVEEGNEAPRLVATEGVVERARVRKDAYELAVLREAAGRLSSVASALVVDVERGRTEREIALALDARILSEGFEKTAFETIVASGPNGALPHAKPTERKLVEGDLVVLDFGGVYDSYCVDLTRTLCLGRATARAFEVYTAVLEAHDSAIHAVRAGVSRFAIDGAARDRLAAAGMAEAFGHGTGHGLGLEVHEEPRISKLPSALPDEPIVPGMVFTIEPGAYVDGLGGVRIEDDVLVVEGGCEVLTDVPIEL